MFPIGWMYYFGTNLENRFSVPDFWPKPEETNKIPFEKEEQIDLAEKLKTARLERRRKRLEAEDRLGLNTRVEEATEDTFSTPEESVARSLEPTAAQSRNGTARLGLIDMWASGKQ